MGKSRYFGFFGWVFSLFLSFQCIAQADEIAIAKEYFRRGDYEKAEVIFKKLSNDQPAFLKIYPEYFQTLLSLKNYREAEKLVKRAIKKYPDNLLYEIDLGLIDVYAGEKEAAAKKFDRLISQVDYKNIPLLAHSFEQKELFEYTEKTWLQGRKLSKNENDFNWQLIQFYVYTNQPAKLINEVIALVKSDEGQLPNALNLLQNSVRDEKEFDLLEKHLISNMQRNPEKSVFPEMLIWMYVQKKDFYSAMIQAKALDKRQRSGGQKVFEIGLISLSNKDYDSAVEAFDYLVKEYKEGPFYGISRQRLINAREEQVKNIFPVDLSKIRTLISDYQGYLAELGKNPRTAEVIKNMASLHAFYLDEKEKAISLLSEVIEMARADQNLVAESKLMLGDIHLLKGEPWESTLLYSQVEKSHKETNLGHEAKLRNAKLNYYKGDFELAQEHLDILKLATSREIANDAMELSLLITDNTGLDTSTAAMADYAAAELLLFQNKNREAIIKLDNILKKYPGHSLTDEIFFLKAKTFIKTGEFQNSLINLEAIVSNPKQDILSDDALFLMAKLYEENLNNPAKAMELYSDLLLKFPASTFVVDARKRFRKLRGDKLN